MRISKRKGLFLILILIIMISLLNISCGTLASEIQEEVTEIEDREPLLTEEEVKELEEAIAEEEADTTDYSIVTAGAELYGYMPSYLCTDIDNYVKIEVTNSSDFTWRAHGNNKVRIGYHFYGQNVDFVEYDKTSRSPLPENLDPGQSGVVEVLINDITNPGTYVVQIDLVLEGHWWFSSKNIPMIEGKVYFNSCLEDRYEAE